MRNILLKFIKLPFYFLFILITSSCVTAQKFQQGVDNMVVTSNYSKALQILNSKPNVYGKKNKLLYLLDKGYVLHLSERFNESVYTLANGKKVFDELYTKSLSNIASTWILNDYAAPYRGEDFESVLINIFQSLNYLMLGKYEDSLVEAREVDSKLKAINLQYKSGQKNVYKEDAFARLLMGILYEISNTPADFNDAFISYEKAFEIYKNEYSQNYNLNIPEILKENLLTTADYMGTSEFNQYRKLFKETNFISLKAKNSKAEVYLIQYNGISPIKVESFLPVPLPDGYIIKIAFPKYQKRYYGAARSLFLAQNFRGDTFETYTETGEDIGAIAIKNLESRRVRTIAKSIVRSAGRYIIERKQEETIRKKHGSDTAGLFKFLSNMFNLFVERADLRCWKTLPDEIRIARLILDPGKYDFGVKNFNSEGRYLGEFDLGKISLSAGEKKFYLIHTVR